MTTSDLVRKGLLVWRILEVIGTIGAFVFGLLVATGWRFQKPAEIVAANEAEIKGLGKRVTIVENAYTMLNDKMNDQNRLLCLLVTRRDANLVGTCETLPTSDDQPSRRR